MILPIAIITVTIHQPPLLLSRLFGSLHLSLFGWLASRLSWSTSTSLDFGVRTHAFNNPSQVRNLSREPDNSRVRTPESVFPARSAEYGWRELPPRGTIALLNESCVRLGELYDISLELPLCFLIICLLGGNDVGRVVRRVLVDDRVGLCLLVFGVHDRCK